MYQLIAKNSHGRAMAIWNYDDSEGSLTLCEHHVQVIKRLHPSWRVVAVKTETPVFNGGEEAPTNA